MKNFKELLEAAKGKSIVLYFGEANPPTLQHLVAFSAVKKIAESIDADHAIVLSKTQNKNNPLSLSQKLEYVNAFYPGFNVVGGSDSMKTSQDVIEQYSKKYKKIILACSSDSINENIQSVETVSYGLHDPDASATSKKMIRAVNEGDYISFRKGLLVHSRDIDARRMFNDMRSTYSLDTIKESIPFNTTDVRERYVAGEIFLENTYVESESQVYKIINRNSNYVTVSNESGILSKKWLTGIQPVEASEETRLKFEGILEMKFTSSDKVKVGKIIGGMLGADVSKGSNAEQMVNAGLRATRGKLLNAEAIAILKNMLKTADDAGIAYDQKLVPKLVVDKKTGEEYDPDQKFDELLNHPDTKAQFKRMKDEQGKGWPKSGAHGQNEDVYSANYRYVTDPVTGETRKSRAKRIITTRQIDDELPAGRTNESAAGVRHVPTSRTKAGSYPVLTTHEQSSNIKKDVMIGGKTFPKGSNVSNLPGGVFIKHKDSDDSSTNSELVSYNSRFGHSVRRSEENLNKIHDALTHNESVELDEATAIDAIKAYTEKSHLKGERYKTVLDANQYVADAHHAYLNSLGGPVVPLPVGHSLGGGDDQLLRRKAIYKMESCELVEKYSEEDIALGGTVIYTKDGKHHISKALRTSGGGAATKIHTSSGHIVPIHHILSTDSSDWKRFQNESYGDSPYSDQSDSHETEDDDINGTEMSDEEIDDLIRDVDDWDDIIDTYDSSELAFIDADTGEHVGEVHDIYSGPEGAPEDDTSFGEPVVTAAAYTGTELPTRKVAESEELNEVLSRLERIKARIRFHRSAPKRQRAIKIALKRHSSTQKIGHRARAMAIKLMKVKIARKPLNMLSIPEKERVERIIQNRAVVINRIALRLMPRIRKIEQTRLSHPAYTK